MGLVGVRITCYYRLSFCSLSKQASLSSFRLQNSHPTPPPLSFLPLLLAPFLFSPLGIDHGFETETEPNRTNLTLKQYRNSVRNFAPLAWAPAHGVAGKDDGDADGDGKTEEKEQEDGDDDDDDSDEEPDEPPPLRGLISSQGISYGGSKGSGGSFSGTAGTGEAEGPRWEPNMELDLGDFDQSHVTYLAEVSVCGRACRGGGAGVKVRRDVLGVEILGPPPTACMCTIFIPAWPAFALTAPGFVRVDSCM